MSIESFIRLLQELLTMVDPNDDLSIMTAESTLRTLCILARRSGKASPITIRCMDAAIRNFRSIVQHRDEFAGVPGNYKANNAKRQRLRDALYPHC